MDTENELSCLMDMRGSLTYCDSYLEAKAERQRHLDMGEDSGLVFCLPSLFDPYSVE